MCSVSKRRYREPKEISWVYNSTIDRSQKDKQRTQERAKNINQQCREVCKSKLPDYMQPSQIMVLEKLTINTEWKDR